MHTIISTSEQQTRDLARAMALQAKKQAKTAGVYCLYGNLGCGKTVFAKGFAEGLGIDPKKIKSPTFTLMKSYPFGTKKLYHYDFYRIQEPDELLANDFEEIVSHHNAIVLIEWPERIQSILPPQTNDIRFEYKDDHTRIITFAND